MYTLQIRQGEFCGTHFLTWDLNCASDVNVFISWGKTSNNFVPDKKETEYKSISFSHGLKQNLFSFSEYS